jgi:hypothetical protein
MTLLLLFVLAPSLDWDTLGGSPAIAEIDTSGRPPMNPPQDSGQRPAETRGGGDAETRRRGEIPVSPSPRVSASSSAGTRDWYRGARDAFMAEPGGPPLWVLMTLNGCPACEELERDAAWVQAMRRGGHFAVFVYDEDPDFGNTIVSNFSTFPFLVRFRWDAGRIRSDVLTDLAAIRRLPAKEH